MNWQSVSLAGLVLTGLCLTCPVLPAQSLDKTALPPLPNVQLENFFVSVQESFSKAYANVRGDLLNAETNGRLGMLLHAYGFLEAAIHCYTRASLLDPGGFRWIYYQAVAEQDLGRSDVAFDSLTRALGLRAGYAPARLRLAEVALTLGRHREAQQAYEVLIRTGAELAPAHFGLGRIHAAAGNLTAALGDYGKACELEPNYASAHYALALVYRQLRDQDRANRHLALYKNSVRHKPKFLPADPLLGEVQELNNQLWDMMLEAQRLEHEQKFDQAAALLRKVLQFDPNLVQAHVDLISIYGQGGQTRAAEKHYRDAIQQGVESPELHYSFALVSYQQEQLDEAERGYQRALALNPAYPQAHNNLGVLLLEQGRLEEAEEHFRSAIQHKPDYPIAHYHLGSILLHREDLKSAITHFSHATQADDENLPAYLYSLAKALWLDGEKENAIDFALKARESAKRYHRKDLIEKIDKDLNVFRREIPKP